MKAAKLMVQALEAEGVERIFSVPGEENLDLMEALRTSDIDIILCRHEQAAGFMAATRGRLTGQAGVVLATLGPGATNLVTAAAYANLGAMPMVMITGQKPIKSSKQGEFQIIDVVDILTPVTKYTRQIVGADYVPARVRKHSELPWKRGRVLPIWNCQKILPGKKLICQCCRASIPGDRLPSTRPLTTPWS